MKKTPPPGYCVHCLNYFSDLTWDHVFPKAWYPDTTPKDIEKWQIPSCSGCNREYGKIEGNLLIRFGLLLDSRNPSTKAIRAKALRAITPELAKSAKDRKHREMKRRQILGDMKRHEVPPVAGILPNFGPRDCVSYPHYSTISIPPEGIEKLGQKIVRGITYLEDQVFIKESHIIEIYFNEDRDILPVIKLIDRTGEHYDRGIGIKVTRTVSAEDTSISLFRIEIWEQLIFQAAVLRRE